jgi:hypothetical protein
VNSGIRPYPQAFRVGFLFRHHPQYFRKLIMKIVTTDSEAIGKTYFAEQINYAEDGAQPVSSEGTALRVAEGPAGLHAISGSWRILETLVAPDNRPAIYKITPDSIVMSTPEGAPFEVTLDGKDYPLAVAPGDSLSMTKVNEREINEIFRKKAPD